MKKFFASVLMIVLASGLVVGGFTQQAAEAAGAADFYKNNVVKMYIGYSPGGGSDYAGRLLASYWSDATDGGAMIVKNMTGAGGLLATNYINSAKPDGLTIGFGMFGGSYLMPHLTKDKGMRFDINKLNWLVGVFHEPFGHHVSVKKPYESAEDLKKVKGLKFASTAPYGPGSILEAIFIDFLGLDAKIITGYKGGSAMALACGKGEVDLAPLPGGTGLDSMNKGFVKPPVVVMSSKRIDIFPDSPAFPELVKFTPEQEALYKVFNAASYVIRVGAAPPGVPEDRIKFMRDAFAKIVKMKGFQTQAKLSFPLGPTPMLADELDAFVAEAAGIDIDPVKALTKKYLAIR